MIQTIFQSTPPMTNPPPKLGSSLPLDFLDDPLAVISCEEEENARKQLQQRLHAYLRKGKPRVILTDNLRTMLSIKRAKEVVSFRLHRMFVFAPAEVIRAIAHYAEKQSREAAALVRAFIDANEHLIRQPEYQRPTILDVQGLHYNVQELFDKLNARYFNQRIQAQITWGPRTKRRKNRDSIKLGSYTLEDGLIRIHPVLDAPDVPQFFVEWVIYHEMLHEIHDMPIVDGRRMYHTREFRMAESQFEYYAEAVLWERMNIHRLLNR